MNSRSFFHKFSYLQYPLIALSLWFILQPAIHGPEVFLESLNLYLLFISLAVSVSTLQDTTKTQNKLSLKVWQDPGKGSMFLMFIGMSAAVFTLAGLLLLLVFTEEALTQISFGLLALGLAMIGMLRAAIEMFEYHRLDKNSPPPEAVQTERETNSRLEM